MATDPRKRLGTSGAVSLFDPTLVETDKLGPRGHNEPSFHYLQTSGKPSAAVVRNLLEQWFGDYPEVHRHELKQRFVTSKSDIHSPTFELALHATFKRLGADVKIHPSVDEGTGTRPDFLVRLSNGFEFYLEAVVARGQSDEERKREQVVKDLYAVIDRNLRSPQYFWSVTLLDHGSAAPSGGKIVNALSQYMAGLDAEFVRAQVWLHGFGSPVKFLWEDAGWRIEFLPLPKKAEAVGRLDHRPLAVFPPKEAAISTSVDDIRKSLCFKAKRHKAVDRPYIIAVNAMDISATGDDFISAIYGSDSVTVHTFPDGSHKTEDTRALDGIWLTEDGLRNQHVIAVMGTVCLNEWSLAKRSLTVYENPYTDGAVPAGLERFPRWEPRNGNLVRVQGETLARLLELPDGWPHEGSAASRS